MACLDKQELEKTNVLILGGLFLAVCRGLGEECAQVARDRLYQLAENRGIKSEEARAAWSLIADSSGLSEAEARRENAALEAEMEARPRPQLRVITGGAA